MLLFSFYLSKPNLRSIKSLLIFYDYFYPGYKAGGPIQSLTNLILSIEIDYEISVITSAYDLNENSPYTSILINEWNTVILPGATKPIQVLYVGKNIKRNDYKLLVLKVNPGVVYFNNIYSTTFFRVPLFFVKQLPEQPRVVICPRGMLQKGALAVKPLKKKLYLAYLRMTGVLNNAWWHATNHEELTDIQKHFPVNKGITVAENIPKPPYNEFAKCLKTSGTLKLVFLSLITEKKNLLHLLEVIKASDGLITLDIFGPVKDAAYWKECMVFIKQIGSRVNYKGDVLPIQVQETLSNYDALILLTKGENFGHALYESLSVGRPVVTSHFTPWVNLANQYAGWNVKIDTITETVALLNKLLLLDANQFSMYCAGAHKMAVTYFNQLETKAKYNLLFSGANN